MLTWYIHLLVLMHLPGHTNCREESDANRFFEPHVVQEGDK
jgi:hypothetical protein